MIHYIDELQEADLEGKRVLLRLDLNVPIDEHGEITDAFRLEKAVSTVDYLRQMKAKTIIIAHLENKEGEAISLLPVWNHLNGFFKVEFCKDFFTPEAVDKLLKIEESQVLMFDNLRFNPGEKENDPDFAKKLAQMVDIYVNDAFSVDHRKHASLVGVPQYLPHYGGLVLKKEIENISKAFNPVHPFVFILGGAKFSTKLPLIQKYLKTADTVFVGGALANDLFKDMGYEVGTSLVSSEEVNLKDVATNPKTKTFVDVTVAEGDDVSFKKVNEVTKTECIMDAGPETVEELRKIISGAKTIVWNGPLGNYEKGFSDKTEQLAEIIAEETGKGATSIIGGGDTVASIQKLNLEHKFTFVSTGGGAMLDYLVNETLPGLEALN